MITTELDFAEWRPLARALLARNVAPEDAAWSGDLASMGSGDQMSFALGAAAPVATETRVGFAVDREFVKCAELVASAREPDRWRLLYRVLYRLKNENPHLMKVATDRDVLEMRSIAKAVARDLHKMHAFVRFKHTVIDGREIYIAWHSPDHLITRLAAPFFARRFGDRCWSICTPDLSAHWDLEKISYSPGIPAHEFPHEDAMDEMWKTYYKSIFNPARVKLKAMHAEMPEKYWSHLPEAETIRGLLREVPERLAKMARNQVPQAEVPEDATLPELRRLAMGCSACPLAANATQTVFGVGPQNAEMMIVGEQPGDNEDLEGLPFVGPAGQVLNDALAGASLAREDIYMTNAVKHFKWKPTAGGTRLHQKPSGSEMHACRPWLEAEVVRVNPRLILLLGATAGTSWLGRLPKITEERGRILSPVRGDASILLSWHPSAILRAGGEAESQARFNELTQDLALAREFLKRSG